MRERSNPRNAKKSMPQDLIAAMNIFGNEFEIFLSTKEEDLQEETAEIYSYRSRDETLVA